MVMNPTEEWRENNHTPERVAQWTEKRGSSSRLYPAALVWCTRKPGRDLQDSVEAWLAWLKVKAEVDGGTLGPEFEKRELDSLGEQIKKAEEDAREEVQGSYRFVSLYDPQAESRLKDHRPGSRIRQRERIPDRASDLSPQAERAAQRFRGTRLHREKLAAGVQGCRGMATARTETEFLGRVPDQTAGYRQCPQTKAR